MLNQVECIWAGFVWDVQTSGLRGEGRRDWEEELRYGAKDESYDYIGIAGM